MSEFLSSEIFRLFIIPAYPTYFTPFIILVLCSFVFSGLMKDIERQIERLTNSWLIIWPIQIFLVYSIRAGFGSDRGFLLMLIIFQLSFFLAFAPILLVQTKATYKYFSLNYIFSIISTIYCVTVFFSVDKNGEIALGMLLPTAAFLVTNVLLPLYVVLRRPKTSMAQTS